MKIRDLFNKIFIVFDKVNKKVYYSTLDDVLDEFFDNKKINKRRNGKNV